MMSAAISIMVGVEQTKIRPVSNDLLLGQGEREDFSFASSFTERIGVSTSTRGENVAEDLTVALPDLKGTTLTKQSEEVAGRSSGVEAKSKTAQEISVDSEPEGGVGGKSVV